MRIMEAPKRTILYNKARSAAKDDDLFDDPKESKPAKPKSKDPLPKPAKTQPARKAATEKRDYKVKVSPVFKTLVATANARLQQISLSHLDFQDKIAGGCWYCNAPSVTVSRIDPEFGWERENSAPICTVCNGMKGDMAENAFLSQIQAIGRANKIL